MRQNVAQKAGKWRIPADSVRCSGTRNNMWRFLTVCQVRRWCDADECRDRAKNAAIPASGWLTLRENGPESLSRTRQRLFSLGMRRLFTYDSGMSSVRWGIPAARRVLRPVRRFIRTMMSPRREIRSAIDLIHTSWAEARFDRAATEPVWLTRAELEVLQARYPTYSPYGYDPDSLARRGEQRAEKIMRVLPDGAERLDRFLELAAFDGMVCRYLKKMGKSATAIDRRDDGFDDRAIRAGVRCEQMDVHELRLPSASYDVVFSYDGFEHFERPDRALDEAIRVVRPGGYIFLHFGPLYFAPMGLHAYRSINVPYCQCLFPPEVLVEFARDHALPPVEFDKVNGWSVESFRELWRTRSDSLRTVYYREWRTPTHLKLVRSYPSCFRTKTTCFDDLLVTSIKVLFQSRSRKCNG